MRIKVTQIIILLAAATVMFYSCQKDLNAVNNLKKSCLYDNKIDYFKKWANTFTEIDVYQPDGITVQSKSFIYPIGYFQLSDNSTYSVLSDNVPLTGKWDVTDSCKLVLDPGTTIQRTFDVLKLSSDSLTIRRKASNIVYTQHYVPYNCPDVSKLEFQWDNTVIQEDYYTATGIINTEYVYPVGSFTLNSNYTYDRPSNGVSLSGVWLLDNNCKLVLDKNTSNERAFDIQKVTTDSLVIWRKDTLAKVNYLQKYKKH